MKNVKTYTARMVEFTRQNSSLNGNPRYSLEFKSTEGEVISVFTAVDDNLAYGITNWEYTNNVVEIEVGSHYGRDTLKSIKVLDK